jgi:hypothetical protein
LVLLDAHVRVTETNNLGLAVLALDVDGRLLGRTRSPERLIEGLALVVLH